MDSAVVFMLVEKYVTFLSEDKLFTVLHIYPCNTILNTVGMDVCVCVRERERERARAREREREREKRE